MSGAISINFSEGGRFSTAKIAIESTVPEGIPLRAHSVDI